MFTHLLLGVLAEKDGVNGAAICGSLAEVYQRIVHVVKEVRNTSAIETVAL